MRTFLFGLVGLLLVGTALSLNKQRDCKCRIQTNSRIIGGRDAAREAIPWQISISSIQRNPVPDHLRKLVPDSQKTEPHFCGGSIISERWILTAAHCVRSDVYNSRITSEIGFGSNDLAQIYVNKQYKKIEAIYIHPDHRPFFYDVALIKLATPLEFNEAVQPACLDLTERSSYDGALKISGWGYTSGRYYDHITPRFLKEADVYDFSHESSCNREHNICLKNEQDYSTSCLGDSGGPIHYTKNGKSSVVGVASFVSLVPNRTGRDRCTGDQAYTRLSSFRSWVESKIGSNYCS